MFSQRCLEHTIRDAHHEVDFFIQSSINIGKLTIRRVKVKQENTMTIG